MVPQLPDRPTDRERVDRYVGQVDRTRKSVARMAEAMTDTLDAIGDPGEERRLKRFLSAVLSAANTLGNALEQEGR